jgi:large subunit ribosomal protein L21
LYAIIEIKGRQLVVREGDIVRIPYDGELEAGNTVKADRVLLVRDDKTTKIGNPEITGASVSLEVTGPGRERKILVYKKKRRKKYRRRQGHRQQYTEAVVARIAAA